MEKSKAHRYGWLLGILGLSVALVVFFNAHVSYAQGVPWSEHVLTIVLDQDTGQNVGVFSVPVDDWGGEDHSRELLVFGNYVSLNSKASVYARSYLNFPVDTLPENVVIERVTLYLYVAGRKWVGADQWLPEGEIGVYEVLAPWDEDMSWTQTVSFDPPALSHALIGDWDAWYTWTLPSEIVQKWSQGDNFGIMLAAYPNPDADPAQEGVEEYIGVAVGRKDPQYELLPRLTIKYATYTPTPTHTPPPPHQPTETPVPPLPPQPTNTPVPPPPPQPTNTPVPLVVDTPSPTPLLLLPMTGARRAGNYWGLGIGGLFVLSVLFLCYRKAQRA